MEYSRAQLGISFHFSVAEWEGGQSKGNDNFPAWLLSENERHNLGTLIFFFFVPETNDIFNEINTGNFKTKKIF